jgi:hypothetical protein
MNMIGSLRYSPCGRKRKTTSLKSKRRSKPTFIAYKPVKTLAQQQMEEFNKKYPSYTGTGKYEPAEDQSWKKEASKNFTVAPAYNKGAYQVVPRNEVKHIGK